MVLNGKINQSQNRKSRGKSLTFALKNFDKSEIVKTLNQKPENSEKNRTESQKPNLLKTLKFKNTRKLRKNIKTTKGN